MNQLNFNITNITKMYFPFRKAILALNALLVLSHSAHATMFDLPPTDNSLIDNNNGQPFYVEAKQEESLIDIAVEHLLGQEEVVRANKTIDRWLPKAGTKVLVPSSYLLPDAPRRGIVINLPEFRLYYYQPKTNKVISYAVGIGRVDWKTPLGVTKVAAKVKNPTWTPPASIRAEHLAKGDVLPEVWPAGTDNPLGLFAFRLAIPGYLLHSTNKPQGIGMQVSHGCMRLYPKDIEQMFPIVEVGTPVNIVNQPVKVGWSNGQLYIESHPTLEGEEISSQQRLDLALSLVNKAIEQQPVSINEAILQSVLKENNGIPTIIASKDNDLSNPSGVDIFDAEPSKAPKPSFPTPENSSIAVPKSQIEEELKREEKEERVFKNSPFPHY